MDSVFNTKSEKNIFRSWEKGKAENLAYFEKDVFSQKNDTIQVFPIFRPEKCIY
jgi:hypothetical protein